MKYLNYLKNLFIAISITIFALYILDNEYITKYVLIAGYLLIFLVPIINNYQKQRTSYSEAEKKKVQK